MGSQPSPSRSPSSSDPHTRQNFFWGKNVVFVSFLGSENVVPPPDTKNKFLPTPPPENFSSRYLYDPRLLFHSVDFHSRFCTTLDCYSTQTQSYLMTHDNDRIVHDASDELGSFSHRDTQSPIVLQSSSHFTFRFQHSHLKKTYSF